MILGWDKTIAFVERSDLRIVMPYLDRYELVTVSQEIRMNKREPWGMRCLSGEPVGRTPSPVQICAHPAAVCVHVWYEGMTISTLFGARQLTDRCDLRRDTEVSKCMF